MSTSFFRRALPYVASFAAMGTFGYMIDSKKPTNPVRVAALVDLCPAKRNDKPVEGVCPISKSSPQNEGTCPVKHETDGTKEAMTKEAVCPVKTETKKEAVCPVKHDQQGGFMQMKPTGQASHGYGLFGDKVRDGPADGGDRYVDPNQIDPYVNSENLVNIPYPHEIPGGRIPATGRGNSVDGADWVNPTPSELFRALRRKQKYIEEHDAYAVAFIHSVVVDSTWEQILKYEEMHKDECQEPTLNRFEGKYGDLTLKTHLNNLLGWFDQTGELIPFDRHDWYVNRCGKEVRYIIDYYATEDIEGNNTYFCDCRPEPNFEGLVDRVKMTWKRLRAGDSIREIW